MMSLSDILILLFIGFFVLVVGWIFRISFPYNKAFFRRLVNDLTQNHFKSSSTNEQIEIAI